MRQLVPRAKRDRTPQAATRKTAARDDAHPGMSTVRHTGVMTYLRRAAAVLLGVVTYTFLLSVPQASTTALAIAYAVSGLCLAVAAWRLWWPTMQ